LHNPKLRKNPGGDIMARNHRFTDVVYKPLAVAALSLALLSPGYAGCTLGAEDSHGQSGEGQAVAAPALLVATEVGLAFLAAGAVLAVAGEHANIALLFSQQGGSAAHRAAHAIISEQAAISGAQQLAQHTLNITLQEQHIIDFANAYVTLPEELGLDPADRVLQTWADRARYDSAAQETMARLVNDSRIMIADLDDAEAAVTDATNSVNNRASLDLNARVLDDDEVLQELEGDLSRLGDGDFPVEAEDVESLIAEAEKIATRAQLEADASTHAIDQAHEAITHAREVIAATPGRRGALGADAGEHLGASVDSDPADGRAQDLEAKVETLLEALSNRTLRGVVKGADTDFLEPVVEELRKAYQAIADRAKRVAEAAKALQPWD
jgi:hypothetical protein